MNLINCLILTMPMAGMVRNPAKTMDKKTKLAGWLFPIPTGRCKVSGNSLDSSNVVIFHTVSRMKTGGMLQSFPQVWKRLNSSLENLDWRVREALDGVVRNTTYGMKGVPSISRYSAGWNINGALRFSLPKEDQGYDQVS